uniref:Uncharacterized protein n=1 Tax=Meloidogyne floridensis TaxID=298350 RepID=A0A915NZX6_9BILA
MDSPPPYSKVCSNPSGVGKVSSNASVGSPNFSGGSASSRTFTPMLPPRFGPNPVEMDWLFFIFFYFLIYKFSPSCKSHILTNIATTPGALPWM